MHSHYAQRSFPNKEGVPFFAPAIRLLLRDGRIANDSDGSAIYELLDTAHRNGYIHLKDNFFVFSSPLIKFQWTWLIAPPRNYDLPYASLRTLVLDTFARFRPVQLFNTERRVGSNTTHPTEAQYQVEFYRALHDITMGNVCISPEYAAQTHSRPGRIDFFIREKNWGIELTCDGRKLKQHADRFGEDGAYGQWYTSGDMIDRILVDCRLLPPRKKHPSTFPHCWIP